VTWKTVLSLGLLIASRSEAAELCFTTAPGDSPVHFDQPCDCAGFVVKDARVRLDRLRIWAARPELSREWAIGSEMVGGAKAARDLARRLNDEPDLKLCCASLPDDASTCVAYSLSDTTAR